MSRSNATRYAVALEGLIRDPLVANIPLQSLGPLLLGLSARRNTAYGEELEALNKVIRLVTDAFNSAVEKQGKAQEEKQDEEGHDDRKTIGN